MTISMECCLLIGLMPSVKKVLRILAAKNNLTLRGSADGRLILFRHIASGWRYSFVVDDMMILGSKRAPDRHHVFERFDLFNGESVEKLDSFMARDD